MSEIFDLCDRATDLLADDDPLTATGHGIAGRDHRWPDLSPEGVAARRALWADLRADATALAAADGRDALARDVLLDAANEAIEEIDAGTPFWDLNSIASPHQELRTVFDLMAKDDIDDWSRIIVRLETIDHPLEGYRASLDEGRRRATLASRRQCEAILDQTALVTGAESPWLGLLDAYDDAGIGDEGLRTRLAGAIAGAQGAYDRFAEHLRTTYLPAAPEADGVGEERYVGAATRFLGTSIDPAETYAWGWEQVETLWDQLQTTCARIDPDASVAEVLHLLQTDPARAATSLEEFVDLMQQRQEDALAALSGVHFDVPAEVQAIEVRTETSGGDLAPHYTSPSEDFSRPGVVWYPVEGRTFFPLFDEITTAYHEGFPGHHLQEGIQVTRAAELSRFHRKMVWYSGSGEGWALYAERLMGELGFLEKPDYEIGLLTSQLLRACRVAIDIGIHCGYRIPDHVTFHPGEAWTFDLAVELLRTRAAEAPENARSEITRYCGWPGQAISYAVGERMILDLRARRRAEPGFDLKAFHRDLLAVGAIGLDRLVSVV